MNRCYCGNGNLIEYSTSYYKCERCNTLVSKYDFDDAIYCVESETEDLYGKNYWEEVMVKEAGVKNVDELIDLYIPERATYWLKKCLKYLKLGSTIAEVGCGLGQFSYVLMMAGFQQSSFELSAQICKYIEKRLGIKTICGELCSSNDKYSAILAMDVFEHLLKPEQFLMDCAERLEEEGILVFQMPCYDAQLTYEEMLEKKPRFKHLLVEDQHTYLYSRESIVNLLKKHGFNNVIFEPAFFGDDYDMFLFASKAVIQENTEEEINQYLNSVPDGRMIKAMIKLFDEKKQVENERIAIDNERQNLLRDVELLTKMVNERETQMCEVSKAAEERLVNIEKLSTENKKLTEEKILLKQEADERLSNIEKLSAENQILLKENEVLKQAADERLVNIEKLSTKNKKLTEEKTLLKQEADERLSNVERLTTETQILLKENEVLKQAADERLVNIEKLSTENKKLTEERALLKQEADERLSNVEKLSIEYQELFKENEVLKQAADDRLSNIEKLSAENQKLSERNEVLKRAADERLTIIEKLLEDNQILQQAADERLAIIERLTSEEEKG